METGPVNTPEPEELCPCGQPLHYPDPKLKKMVSDFMKILGPTIPVRWEGRTWKIPRHFIALHGVRSEDLPALAQRYGFEEVK